MLMSSTFNICEICGEPRSKKIHRKCSRILQKRSREPQVKAERAIMLENERNDALQHSVRKSLTARFNAIIHN